MVQSDQSPWQRAAEAIDRWFVPAAFGALTLLVVTQGVTAIPAVRQAIDNRAGRSITPALSTAREVTGKSADVTFYVSPAGSRPDIRIMVNGRYEGNLAAGHLTVALHQGDSVRLVAPNTTGRTEISVEDNNPYLVSLFPGMVFSLSTQAPSVALPTVKFLA